MPKTYILSFDKTSEEIEKLLISQGVGFSQYGTIKIGSTGSILKDSTVLNNPYLQKKINHSFSDIWYCPDNEAIIVRIYNLDSKESKEMYPLLFTHEMRKVLIRLKEKLPQVDFTLVGRNEWNKSVDLSLKEIMLFEEAKVLYRTGIA